MMETNKWLDQEINDLKKDETSFKLISILEGTKSLAAEQAKRLQQAQDELDGRTWSPDKW
ncbi:hypothetical protein DY124_01070 [Apilactobacillus micheneri]|uniref:Uncharacterized protein n=2 Tax=Apilactobacillus micheneri TaxID=1899430 RepID=A0A9Q8IND0_9LACO|nr:hypothetical protein DY114_04795 [Apilactobacillus micheneri]TPR25912.1 hypothetical protein DY111_04795 [Apilactobacillus micheneri]TPR28102.1 hypothetical protein DY113_02740 [Apilactobacillus micheneri]TPR29593.1 hypothetical protein DY117_04795 [Apilactobacillus micheneri]TPR30379.1 hypothetical protein DY120_04795 [Apilactobacillus micheneri]